MKFVSEAYSGGVGGRMEPLNVSYYVYILKHSLHLLFSGLLSVCRRPNKDLF